MRHPLLRGALATALALAAAAAQADAFIMMVRQGHFVGFSNLPVRVPLNAAGATATPAFEHRAGERFVVSYTAECGNDLAAARDDVVRLQIRAVNVATGQVTVLRPTHAEAPLANQLCGSNVSPGFDGLQMSSMDAVTSQLPSGRYRIELQARTINNGRGWLGDSSLIVWR